MENKNENSMAPFSENHEVILLSLGSNLGDKVDFLRRAVHELSSEGVAIQAISSIYHTPPWGNTDQPAFVNIGIIGITDHSPHELLQICQSIENRLGRTRMEHWGPRTLDIDIIYYGGHVLLQDNLQIPHPFRIERSFVMIPLSEIAPDWVDPVLSQTIAELSAPWSHLDEPLRAEPWF